MQQAAEKHLLHTLISGKYKYMKSATHMFRTNATREPAKQHASKWLHIESGVVALLTIALMLSTGSNPIKGPKLACMLANLVSRSS